MQFVAGTKTKTPGGNPTHCRTLTGPKVNNHPKQSQVTEFFGNSQGYHINKSLIDPGSRRLSNTIGNTKKKENRRGPTDSTVVSRDPGPLGPGPLGCGSVFPVGPMLVWTLPGRRTRRARDPSDVGPPTRMGIHVGRTPSRRGMSSVVGSPCPTEAMHPRTPREP